MSNLTAQQYKELEKNPPVYLPKQKKITRATIKSFVKRELNNNNLHINVLSSFDGMVDCIMPLKKGFIKAEKTNNSLQNNLGVQGIWLVGQSRNYFDLYADEDYIGYKVYNSCGTFIIAMKRLL